MESQLGPETHFCKSNIILQILSCSIDEEAILYELCLEPSVDEKRNNRLQSEALRLKNAVNKMNTNVFYDVWLKGNRVPKECSFPGEEGKDVRGEIRVPRGSRRTTQSGGNSEPSENLSSVNGWMFCGVRGSWRNKGCIVHCAGQIVMTCQEKGGGCKTLGRGVGVEVLRGESVSWHVLWLFSNVRSTLRKCLLNQNPPKHSRWWGHNKSSGFCPKCSTSTTSFNSMRLAPTWQVRKLRITCWGSCWWLIVESELKPRHSGCSFCEFNHYTTQTIRNTVLLAISWSFFKIYPPQLPDWKYI